MHMMDCSCAPILQFFSAVSGGTTANRQIPNSIFWPIFYRFEVGQRRQLCIDLSGVFGVCQRTRCALQVTKRLIYRQVAPQDSQICGRYFPKRTKNRQQSCAKYFVQFPVMLILVLVLKDSLRTKFKFLSWSLQAWSMSLSLPVQSLTNPIP